MFFLISHFAASQQSVPQWVDGKIRKSSFGSYYYLSGYSYSNKNPSETEYDLLKRLTGNAKQELIESIAVTIKGETTLKTESTKNAFNQKLSQEVSAIAEAEIYGLIVETYYNKVSKTGYAFAYVNKKELRNYFAAQFNAQTSALKSGISDDSLNLKSEFKLYTKNIVSHLTLVYAIKKSHQILALLSTALDPAPSIDDVNKIEVNLSTNLNNAFKNILIKPIDTIINPSLKSAFAFSLGIKVTYKLKSEEGLPLIVYSINDNFKNTNLTTDKSGLIVANVSNTNLYSLNKRFKAIVNLASFLDTIILNRYKFISIPFIEFNLKVKKTTICVTNANDCSDVIIASVKEFFAQNGYLFSTNTAISKYTINLSCKDRFKRMNNLYFGYADVSLSIIENSSNIEMYQTKVTDCKGGGGDPVQATNKAYITASKKIIEALKSIQLK